MSVKIDAAFIALRYWVRIGTQQSELGVDPYHGWTACMVGPGDDGAPPRSVDWCVHWYIASPLSGSVNN
jgi:hypothetical protein